MPTLAQRVVDWMGMNEIPEIAALNNTHQASVKLADFGEWDAAVSHFVFAGATDFAPIRFHIRDNEAAKKTVLKAQVESGKGVVVYDMDDCELLTAALPSHSAKSLGEIRSASGFTAYVVSRVGDNGDLSVAKTVGSPEEKPLQVKRVKNRWCQLSSFFLGTWESWEYEIRHCGVPLARVTPRGLSSTNSYQLSFLNQASCAPGSLRPVCLGVALLLTLDKGYPPMRNLLRQSCQPDD